MINYITKIIKNRDNRSSMQSNSDHNNSFNKNVKSSSLKNNLETKDKLSIDKTEKKNPSSLLWVFKINFNGKNNQKIIDGMKKDTYSGNLDNILMNEDYCNAVVTKITSIKLNKIDKSNNIGNQSISNKPNILNNNTSNSSQIGTLVNGSKNTEVCKINKGNKTSDDKFRRNINKNENNLLIKEKESEKLDGYSEGQTNSKKSNAKSISNPNIEKKTVVKESTELKPSKLNLPIKLDQNKTVNNTKDPINILKKENSIEKISEIREKVKAVKKLKKKKKNKKKIVEISESDIIARIRLNLQNLYEKQKINRLDYKFPRIENRIPEQKRESSPGLNINSNINSYNSNSPSHNFRSNKFEVKIEINQNFFKKSFEYSPNENSDDNSCYNSYIYNKEYLKYIDKIIRCQNEAQFLIQSPQIILPNYTYVNFVRCDNFILEKVMKHRINWAQTLSNKLYNFRWNYSTKGLEYNKLVTSSDILDKQKIVNHFEYHTEITDKRRLFINLLKFCDLIDFDLFKIIPFTIIISYRKDSYDVNIKAFSEIFNAMNEIKRRKYDYTANPKGLNGVSTNYETIFNKNYTDLFNLSEREKYLSTKVTMSIPHSFFAESNLWIIKPIDLCQGNCMKISNELPKIIKKVKKYFSGIDQTFKDSDDDEEHKKQMDRINIVNFASNDDKSKSKEKTNRYSSSTVLLQKYLENPLLYMNRKFDIRVWVLIDCELNVYVFKEGHLKCSSEIYERNNKNQFIHITNYSVQKHSNNFEKYEFGNEVSFSDFQKHLDKMTLNINIQKDIMFKLKKIIQITALSSNRKINKKNAKYCFEILGYDFIIDCNLDVWLLEVNDNPGLCESSPLIKILVPRMLDDAFRLTIDKVFQTKYEDGIMKNGVYISPFHVENYSNEENMFDFICNVNVDPEDYCKNIRSVNLN